MNMARISIFLIVAALIVGLIGCVGGNGNGGGSYTLVVDFTAGGKVAVDDVPIPGKAILTYDPGTVVNLAATSDAGYRFVEWAGNASTIDDVNAASTTITIDSDYSITANFFKQYNLTISSTAGGSVTMPGEGTYAYDPGKAVNLVAQAEEGYHFVNWTAQAGTFANASTAETNFTMPSQNAMVTANFATSYSQIGEVLVSALLEGVNFTAPSTGIYRFTITGGTGQSIGVEEYGHRNIPIQRTGIFR